jgi:hypothetical protein
LRWNGLARLGKVRRPRAGERQDGMAAEILDEPLGHGFPGLGLQPELDELPTEGEETRQRTEILLQEPDDQPGRRAHAKAGRRPGYRGRCV